MPALAVDDRDIGDVVAFAADQRRQESVQPVEQRQPQKQIARESLQPAAGIACTVAKHRAAHGIGDARLQFLEAGRLAPNPLTRDEPDSRGAGRQGLRHFG